MRTEDYAEQNCDKFQFHKGTIRTGFLINILIIYQISIP